MASVLQEKSKAFALQIIKVCNEIKQSKRESVLTNQLRISREFWGAEASRIPAFVSLFYSSTSRYSTPISVRMYRGFAGDFSGFRRSPAISARRA